MTRAQKKQLEAYYRVELEKFADLVRQQERGTAEHAKALQAFKSAYLVAESEMQIAELKVRRAEQAKTDMFLLFVACVVLALVVNTAWGV